MLTTLVLILFLLAAFALVWWGVGRMSVPEPIKTIVLVVMGLIVLAMLYHLVVRGGLL